MSKNIDVVLEILRNEVDGDVAAALQKMTSDYSMTWMYKGKHEIFPESSNTIEKTLTEEVYPIKGRKYEIKHIAEGENVVMVELIESYPDPETQRLYQTPLVLVLEMRDGKIHTGRHYCDPQISHEDLPAESIKKAFKGSATQIVIE
jgi:ketosteroid isomerase-like protein